MLGRRFELVSGSQRRQVCQTPFGGTSAMNTKRPLANWGLLSERSAWMTSSRTNLQMDVTVRSSRFERNQRALISPRRTSRPALTSKMSAKSDSISISIVRRTGRRP